MYLVHFDKQRSGFLWSGQQGKKNYHLVNWKTVCLPKDQGGLGVLDLKIMNIALLAKWLWKLFNEKGLWQSFLHAKYLSKTTFGLCSQKKENHIFGKV